jgi:hypothetical protein
MDEHWLEVAAGLASVRGDAASAARLHGASLARIRGAGAKRESTDEAFLAPLLARARESLGPAAFETARARRHGAEAGRVDGRAGGVAGEHRLTTYNSPGRRVTELLAGRRKRIPLKRSPLLQSPGRQRISR